MPEEQATAPAPVRAFWSGTLTFGLVSIPVDFYAAARARATAMKLVDAKGHPLGRQYTREDTGKALTNDDIVRGYETGEGQMIVITDREFESAAPESSRDIELNRFVPLEQISPTYFVRPYFLAPGMGSGKAYSLLAETMHRSGKAGIGRFVMRGHEYLLAVIAEGGVLRAETLRYFDELRTPESIGLPAAAKPPKKLVREFSGAISGLLENRLDLHELEDREAERLEELARRKQASGKGVIALDAAQEDASEPGPGAEIIDLVQLLRRSLGSPAPAGKESGGMSARPDRREKPEAELADKTRGELYAIASEMEIPGRSKMKKAALLKAIGAARAGPAATGL